MARSSSSRRLQAVFGRSKTVTVRVVFGPMLASEGPDLAAIAWRLDGARRATNSILLSSLDGWSLGGS